MSGAGTAGAPAARTHLQQRGPASLHLCPQRPSKGLLELPCRIARQRAGEGGQRGAGDGRGGVGSEARKGGLGLGQGHLRGPQQALQPVDDEVLLHFQSRLELDFVAPSIR